VFILDLLRGSPSSRKRSANPEFAFRPSPMTVQLGLALVSGLLIGALTEWLVLRVSFALTPLSNSAAPWIIVAFLVALTARSVRQSLGLAVVTLLAAVVGFYLGQGVRGWAVSGHQLAFWCTVAVVAGPVIGLSAGWLRHVNGVWGAVGSGVLGGLLIGEALHGLSQPTFLTPHDYWHVQLGLGGGLVVVLAAWNSRDRRHRRVPLVIVSIAACAAVALATAAVYRVA
jgi:hypothetical protein